MRLDKFLKTSRIIKRRTLANEACSGGCVRVNGKTAKPSAEVKAGDEIEVSLGRRVVRYEVVQTAEHVLKQDAAAMYRVIEETKGD